MLTKERKTAGHTDRVTVTHETGSGWEVKEERDGLVISRVNYLDWHRVERALQLFELAIPRPRTT